VVVGATVAVAVTTIGIPNVVTATVVGSIRISVADFRPATQGCAPL